MSYHGNIYMSLSDNCLMDVCAALCTVAASAEQMLKANSAIHCFDSCKPSAINTPLTLSGVQGSYQLCCRELFEAWCEDPRNGVIIADFAVAGTLAREVLDEPKEIMSHSGHKVSLDAWLAHFDLLTWLLHPYLPHTKVYAQDSGL